MTDDEKRINLNCGFKTYGNTPHTIAETGRECLSTIPEKTDQELYAQPEEKENTGNSDSSDTGETDQKKEDNPSGEDQKEQETQTSKQSAKRKINSKMLI